MVRLTETEGRRVGAGGWGSRCLMGTDVQFGKMKRVLWVDGGDGCTAVSVSFMPLNCTLRNA